MYYVNSDHRFIIHDINKYEDKIRGLDYERCAFYYRGRQVYEITSGQKYEISLPDMKIGSFFPSGCVVTHNHPDSANVAPFLSRNDIYTALKLDLSKIRAVSGSGDIECVVNREKFLDKDVTAHRVRQHMESYLYFNLPSIEALRSSSISDLFELRINKKDAPAKADTLGGQNHTLPHKNRDKKVNA